MITECAHCGAPLDTEKSTSSVRCAYCGRKNQVQAMRVVYEVRPIGWQPVGQWTPPAHAAAKTVPLAYRPHRHATMMALVGLLPVLIGVAVPLLAIFGPQLRSLLFPWDGKSQLVCSGNDDVTLDGVKVKAKSSPAIVAEVNCELTIRDSSITAESLIEVRGNGKVRIEGSTLTATGARGLAVDDNGNLLLVETKLRVRPAGTQAKVTGITAGGNFAVELQKSGIEVRASRTGGAITVVRASGNKHVRLRDSAISIGDEPRPGAITLFELDGNAHADVEGGSIDAAGKELGVGSRRPVSLSGVELKGRIVPRGGAQVNAD